MNYKTINQVVTAIFFLIGYSQNLSAQKKSNRVNSMNSTKWSSSVQPSKLDNSENMIQNVNPLMCDPDSGICEIPQNTQKYENEQSIKASTDYSSPEKEKKAIKIIYFTDPICSSCWGIEPQLRKLKLEYGDEFQIEYKMGGLLPDWSYNSGGISKPSDVAHHWDEVSLYYQMPIDGDIWLENPLSSSYPPSIAFKAAQIQDGQKAIVFLRILREMVFLEKKNITENNHIRTAAQKAGLDPDKLLRDMTGKGLELFSADLQLAQSMSVRGFPTLILNNSVYQTERIYGFNPYSLFETAINKLAPLAQKKGYSKDWMSLFSRYSSLTLREFSKLSELDKEQSKSILDDLVTEKKLTELKTKNGSLWILNH